MAKTEEMVGQITVEGDVAVVTFVKPSLSSSEDISAVSEQVRRLIGADHPKHIIFDFRSVKFFSSQVLGLLLETRSILAACQGSVVIASINPQLHRVFKITNLDKVFQFFPDRESAVKQIQSG